MSSGTVPPCPHCGGTLKYRDSRLRIQRKEGGECNRLLIRRFRCCRCGHFHTELPDCLLPYKHYQTEVISGAIEGTVTPKDLDSEDYPCVATMQRWIQWFQGNIENIEGYLRKACSSLTGRTEIQLANVSLLNSLRKNTQNWLEKAVRTVYNSGGFLPSGLSLKSCTHFVLSCHGPHGYSCLIKEDNNHERNHIDRQLAGSAGTGTLSADRTAPVPGSG